MNGISDKKRIVWDEEPKIVGGIELYPITMLRYSEWLACKRALTLRQSTLPAAYAVMPYLSALHAMDAAYQTPLLHETMQILAMATRRPMSCFQARAYEADRTKLAYIQFSDGGYTARITPQSYPAIRATIAEQNGEQLPDEGDNPELIEAENDVLTTKRVPLEWDPNEMIASVAYQYRERKKDLLNWTIREFEEARRAIDRDKSHMICAIAEHMPYMKWKDGNPVPSWCLDRAKTGTAALESMGEFMRRTGVGGNAMPMQNG